MTPHVFINPDGRMHQRWVEAFGSVQVVTDARQALQYDGAMVWLSTRTRAWQVALRTLRDAGVRVVVVSTTPQPMEAARALDLGARGYAHAWSTPGLLKKIATVVEHDGYWIGVELMRSLVGMSGRLSGTNPGEDRALLLSTLTTREKEVARAVCEGKTNKEIARDLVIGERTVKAHLASIFGKLAVRDRLHLALRIAATTDDKLPL